MQTLSGKFCIGSKAAAWLLIVMLGGIAFSSFVPKEWALLQTLSQLLMMFSAGMLASQHAAIWEPVPPREKTSQPEAPEQR